MLKRVLIVCCFLAFAATSLTTQSGCSSHKTVVEHDRGWHH